MFPIADKHPSVYVNTSLSLPQQSDSLGRTSFIHEPEDSTEIDDSSLESALKDKQIIDKWNVIIKDLPLFPVLDNSKGDFELINALLKTPYKFDGCSGEFYIAEFLSTLWRKFHTYIELIELVGGSVNTVLSKDFLCRVMNVLEVKNPERLITDPFMDKKFRKANDFDFRITLKKGANDLFLLHAEQASHNIYEEIRRTICYFLAHKNEPNRIPTKQDCMNAWDNVITKKIFKPLEGLSICGMKGDGIRLELAIFEQSEEESKRKFLFIVDDLRIPLEQFLSNQFVSFVNLESENGHWPAIFAKTLRNIGILEIPSMNIFAFALWFTKQVNGYSCPASECLNTFTEHYVKLLKSSPIPKGYLASTKISAEYANVPALIAFHHHICLENHLKGTANEAFVLGFLLCSSLESYLSSDVLMEAWKHISARIKKSNAISAFSFSSHLNALSSGKMSFKQMIEWLSFSTIVKNIANDNLPSYQVKKIPHLRNIYLQILLEDCYMVLPIIPIPSAETIKLAKIFFPTEQLVLNKWNPDVGMNPNYEEELEILTENAERLQETIKDPLMTFELLALISTRKNVKDLLLNLLPELLIILDKTFIQRFNQIFNANSLQSKAFVELMEFVGKMALEDKAVLQNDTSRLEILLNFVAQSADPYLENYASMLIKKLYKNNQLTISTYLLFSPCLIAYNPRLAIKIFHTLNLTSEQVIQFINLLLKASVTSIIDGFDESIVNELCQHLSTINIKAKQNQTIIGELFPDLEHFEEKLLSGQKIHDLKKLMILLKQKYNYSTSSTWLKCAYQLSTNDYEATYLFLKEGLDHHLLTKNEEVVQLLLSLIEHISLKIALEIIKEVISSPLTTQQNDKIKAYLLSGAFSNNTLELIDTVLSSGVNRLEENTLQDLRIDCLKKLLADTPIDFNKIESLIKTSFGSPVNNEQTISFFDLLNTFLSKVNHLKAINILLLSEVRVFFSNNKSSLYTLLYDILEKIKDPSLLPLNTIESILSLVCENVPNDHYNNILQKILLDVIERLNLLWQQKTKLTTGLTKIITEKHCNIIELLNFHSFNLFYLLNIYNVSLSIEQNAREIVYQSFKAKIDSNPESVHLVLKNSFECKRISINDPQCLEVLSLLIQALLKRNYPNFAHYWADRIISKLSFEIMVELIQDCLKRRDSSSSLKYLKLLDKNLDNSSLSDPQKLLLTQLYNDYIDQIFSPENNEIESQIKTLIKNSSQLIKHVNFNNKIRSYTTYISYNNDESVIQALEFLLKFKIFHSSEFEHITKQIGTIKKHIEKAFGLYLKILDQMPGDQIDANHRLVCLCFLKKLRDCDSCYGKNLILKPDLFVKIFNNDYEKEIYIALRHSISLISTETFTPFMHIFNHYRHLHENIYNTELSLVIQTIQIYLFTMIENEMPANILQACQLINRSLSHLTDPDYVKRGFTLGIFGNRIEEIVHFAERDNSENTSSNIPLDLFTHREVLSEIEIIIEWFFHQNDQWYLQIPVKFFKFTKAFFSSNLLMKLVNLLSKCEKAYRFCSEDKLEDKIEIINLYTSALVSCANSNEKEAMDFVYHFIQNDKLILTKEQFENIVDSFLSNQLQNQNESDENKIAFFHELFNQTSQLNFSPGENPEFETLDSKFHYECIETCMIIIARNYMKDRDFSKYHRDFSEMEHTLSKKISIEHPLRNNESFLKEWHFCILDYIYKHSSPPLQLNPEPEMQQFCLQLFYKTFETYQFYFDHQQLTNLQFLRLIEIMAMHALLFESGLENFISFIKQCLETVEKMPFSDAKIHEAIFQFRLMKDQHKNKEIEICTSLGSYHSFESNLLTERKIELTYFNVRALSSVDNLLGIELAVSLIFNTQDEYMRFDKTTLDNCYLILLNGINHKLNLNKSVEYANKIRGKILKLTPHIPKSVFSTWEPTLRKLGTFVYKFPDENPSTTNRKKTRKNRRRK